MIQEFESDFRPPLEPMVAYHKSTASLGEEPAREWCCVSGHEDNSSQEAIEAAERKYGGSWLMPHFVERPSDWPSNPKWSDDGKRMLWILVRG